MTAKPLPGLPSNMDTSNSTTAPGTSTSSASTESSNFGGGGGGGGNELISDIGNGGAGAIRHLTAAGVDREQTHLPLDGGPPSSSLERVLDKLNEGGALHPLPPQHIPRPVHDSSYPPPALSEDAGAAFVGTTRQETLARTANSSIATSSHVAATAAKASSIDSTSLQPPPSPRLPSSQQRPAFASPPAVATLNGSNIAATPTAGAPIDGTFSPPDPDPARTLANSNRSSIDDIRRIHAQRAARNLESVTGSSSSNSGRSGGTTGHKPAVVDELQPSTTASGSVPGQQHRFAHQRDSISGLATGAAVGTGRVSSSTVRPASVIEPRMRDGSAFTHDTHRSRPLSSTGETRAPPLTVGEAAAANATVPSRSVTQAREGTASSATPTDRERRRAAAATVSAAAATSAPTAERSERSERSDHRDRDRDRRSRRTLGDYALGKTLGAGSMGKVKLGVKMGNGEKVAIKIIPRHTSLAAAQQPRSSQHQSGEGGSDKPVPPPTASFLAKAAAKDHSKEVRTIREGSLQLLLHHPYVCGMREMIIHPNHYYMIFEYVNGGQMLDYIISHGRLRERAARKFARQIGSALEYCHRNSIVHRDLKIENILISKTGNIKIIDFGLSNLFSPHSHLNTFCGSLYFAAPELLNAKAYTGPEVDVWSFGIVLYVLVCGKVPFDDQSMPALHAKIKKGQVEYPAWLSGECKHILSRMLTTNPALRATLPEILAHPWMVKGYEGVPEAHIPVRQPLRTQSLDPEVIKGMTGFEFGTPEDIEARMLEVLTSEGYQQALQAWEVRHGLSNGSSISSATLSGSSPLNRSSTRASVDSKARPSSKRFSGIDFYRKKLGGSSLFGSKDDAALGNAVANGDGLGIPGGGVGQQANKEPLDPTRGFHPLISIYYLVSEKMERERLYGHSFFASSNVSLNGNNVAAPPVPTSFAAKAAPSPPPSSAAAHQMRQEVNRSTMPTAADIPTEALRVPEISHIPTASRRDGPALDLPAPPVSARTTGGSLSTGGMPTPVFDSRQKSQPMANMTGPPRPRAMGNEVEAALRGGGPTGGGVTPVSSMITAGGPGAMWNAPTSTATASTSDGNARSGSISNPGTPALLRNSSLASKTRANSQNNNVVVGAQQPLPPTPFDNDAAVFASRSARVPVPTTVSDKRRSYHGGESGNSTAPQIVPTGTTVVDQIVDTRREPSSMPSTPQGVSLARRFGSMMLGRSPSTPTELDARERRRQGRMSTGGIGTGSLVTRRSSMQSHGTAGNNILGQVEESQAGERRAAMEEDEDDDRVDYYAGESAASPSRTSGAVQKNLRATPAASMSRASGTQFAASRGADAVSVSRRPSSAQKRSDDRPATQQPEFSTPSWQSGRGGDNGNHARSPDQSPLQNKNSALDGEAALTRNIRVNSVGGATTTSASDHASSKPIFLKGLFSVQTTTTKPRTVLHADLVRVLERIGLQYRDIKSGYECVHLPSLDFSMPNDASGTGTSGRGNARITPLQGGGPSVSEAAGTSSSAFSDGGIEGGTPKARRKPSRISFASRKERSRATDGSSINDSIDDGGEGRRNNTSSREEVLIAADVERASTPSRSTSGGIAARPRTDSLGAPSFMQSHTQSPVLNTNAATFNLDQSSSSSSSQPPPVPSKAGHQAGGGSSQAMPVTANANSMAMELAVRFEIYVVKVPLLLGVNGLQFRRISGNPWQYQQLARRVLQELKL